VIVDPAQRLIELLSAILTNASPRAAKVAVAFSGGVDSMLLLAALARSRRLFARVRALHVNHHLLPEADEWAVFCRSAARRLRVPCEILSAEGKPRQGDSREEWARGARYAALSKVLEPGELLVTAHHANDQAETLLLQLLRGAGVAGLAGMPAIAPLGRAWIARPMLALTRAEIATAARDAGLDWIEDSSNADEKIARNYLRRRVLPVIVERWPAAVSVLSRSAQHLADARKLLDEQAAADLALAADGIGLSATALRKLPFLRRKNLLRHWIATSGARVPETSRLAELAGPMLSARHDALPSVAWQGARVSRVLGRYELTLTDGGRKSHEPTATLAARRNNRLIDWRWRKSRSLATPEAVLSLTRDPYGPIDLDRLPAVLQWRPREGGERIRLDARGSRSLKTLLQAARVAPADRSRWPLLFSGDTLIIAGDRWAAASVCATAKSKARARLAVKFL
jgi:tRNA(Ile)-lysidine synthase